MSTAIQKPGHSIEAQADVKPVLYLAEFNSTADVMHAAEIVRDAGYKKWDVHTPFPIHGMDKAMGMSDSFLGWIVLACGLAGGIGGFALIWWTNGIDYPLVIGGKTPFAIPSMIPVVFELTILLSAFGAVFGMLGVNQLPRHHHPVFFSERFEKFSDDKFFISIEAGDPKFNLDETKALLQSSHPAHLELIEALPEESA